MQYCKNCVYPIAAVNLQVDEEGVCSSCRTFDKFSNFSDEKWEERRQRLANVLRNVRYYNLDIHLNDEAKNSIRELRNSLSKFIGKVGEEE